MALIADNTRALSAEAERLDTRLRGRPVLPPLLHADLKRRRDAIGAFLAQAAGGSE